MNIQIFGTGKSFDTKKAQRYFKERRISFQFIDMKEKGLSKGELSSVAQAVVSGLASRVTSAPSSIPPAKTTTPAPWSSTRPMR